MLEKGYAERIDEEDDVDMGDSSKIWYVPHHSVVNPRKPEKL